MNKEAISYWFQGLQDRICNDLEVLDGTSKFHEDTWTRPGGGGGRTRVMQKGTVIEKGGVNFSEVTGNTPEQILKELNLKPADFFATGVSIVLHPNNPWVPIIHMNVRYFEMSNGNYWFGGGIDLTPHYVDTAMAAKFHDRLKFMCDRFSKNYYPEFKKWADDYFYLKHRNETRGIGGLFFDRLSENAEFSNENRWEFVKALGDIFIPAYSEQVQVTRDKSFSENEKNWQLLRRGRYVEFNLVWDKGTKFGLDTDGRTESILMSLPPMAVWAYDYQPNEGTKEAHTLELLKKGINWLET